MLLLVCGISFWLFIAATATAAVYPRCRSPRHQCTNSEVGRYCPERKYTVDSVAPR